MALFQSYAVIYLAIGAAIHEVLFVFCSYPNDDTETATFDRTVATDSDVYVDNGSLRLSYPSQPVSVYDCFRNTRSKRRGGLYSLASYGYIRYQRHARVHNFI